MTNEVQALVAKRKVMRFNAPFGARCFLTINYCEAELTLTDGVLMHRLALGAF